MARTRELAEFLRARRALVKPEDVGLAHADHRRVPGLRREELALLAGLSADYYMRLEQGRGHQPSKEVLEALARALRLDADATTHLLALGRATPSSAHLARMERVRPDLQDLLDAWDTTPALIHGRRLDVLAANTPARALTPLAEPGSNMVRSVFFDPDVRRTYEDLGQIEADIVAYLRATAYRHGEDPGLAALVTELSAASAAFRRLWPRHEVKGRLAGDRPFFHPVQGPMHLRFQTFGIDGTEGQTLFVVHAVPGSSAARALARLTADREAARPETTLVSSVD